MLFLGCMRGAILCAYILIAGATVAGAQPTQFDVFTITMPPGYTSKEGKTFLDFLKYNEKKTAYAQVTFYRAHDATSDLKAEFEKQWNALVKNKKPAPPLAESETENGWVASFGAAPVASPEGNYIQTLILFAGNKKVAGISVRATDTSFSKEIEDILQSVELKNPNTIKPVVIK